MNEWDEVIVTKNPDLKEVEVSFVKAEPSISDIPPTIDRLPECSGPNPPDYCERLP